MNNYLYLVERFPKLILFTLFVITVFFAYSISFLSEDSNPYLLSKDHPARSSLYAMREDFTGTHNAILLAIYNPDSVINETSLRALFDLTQSYKTLSLIDPKDEIKLREVSKNTESIQLEKKINAILQGGLNSEDSYALRKLLVEAQDFPIKASDLKFLQFLSERIDPIKDVSGLAGSENIFLEPDGTLRAAVTVNSRSVDINRVNRAVHDNELITNSILSPDKRVSLIALEVSILSDDSEGQLRAYDAVHNILANYQNNNPQWNDEVYIGGVPVFYAEQKRIIDADMQTLFPAVILLVSAILAFFFRTALGVLIPLVNVVMCTIWTLGAMAIVGIPLDLITSVLPVFLITICSSDAIHVMAEYYRQRKIQATQHLQQREVVANTMRLMVSPVILTTITTCVTFTVSTMTSITNLKNFGITMSFGMFVAMVISLLLIPAWLSLQSDNVLKIKQTHKQNKPNRISLWLLTLIKPVMANRKPWILGTGVAIFVLIAIGSQVRIDDMGSAYFDENNRFRIADEFINSHIAGSSPGWIEIDTGKVDGAITPELVAFIDHLEKFIHKQDNITYSYSIARYIRRINFVMNNMDPSYNRLPNALEIFTEFDEALNTMVSVEVQGKDIIRQAILLYENGGGTDLTNILSSDYSKTAMMYTMNTTVANDYQAFLDVLIPWLNNNIPDGMTYKLAGTPVVWSKVLHELISGQLLSIFMAFICVIIIMGLWLKSWRMGLLGTLPLAVTVACYYAMMTLFNIELNIGTAIISFLVLGVVDYSVHYLLRTEYGLKQGLSLNQSLEEAVIHSGRSITVNVIVFSVGFVALLFSEFQPIVDLGRLVGFSLLISGVMSIFIITLMAPWLMPNVLDKPKLADNHQLGIAGGI